MTNKQLETTMNIMNLDDISVNTRILLYFFVSIFTVNKNNNIIVNYYMIQQVLAMPKEGTDELLLELQLKNYIKIQKENDSMVSLTTKTLNIIK